MPDRIVVVVVGYIGMELATAFAKLSVNVTVIEVRRGGHVDS